MPLYRTDLPSLLDTLDPDASRVHRHLWLLGLVEWIRGDDDQPQASVARLRLWLDAAQARPEWQARWRQWREHFTSTVDLTPLWADLGFAPRVSFLSEFFSRLRRRWMPATPDTHDAEALFAQVFRDPRDAQWLRAIDPPTLERARALLFDTPPTDPLSDGAGAPTATVAAGPHDADNLWVANLVDAVVHACSQVSATGFSSEIRTRMSPSADRSRPFQDLTDRLQHWRATVRTHGAASDAGRAHGVALRRQLEICRRAAFSVYGHFEDYGISVGIVFRLRQLAARVRRIEALLDTLESPSPARAGVQLTALLVQQWHEGVSLRRLVASNAQLVAARVAERSAETGEQYITRDMADYRHMLAKAAGGGAIIGFTTWFKFLLGALALSSFWAGFAAGLNYALSFLLVQVLHFTVATKQPAVTAPAMVAKLHRIRQPRALRGFVDEVANLLRSQIAAILGNLALVVPTVLAIDLVLRWWLGHPMIDTHKAEYVVHSVQLDLSTLLFAAFTGVLLFASSIIAGWTENAFVLYRLDSALAYSPRLTRWLGARRAARWAAYLRTQVSGFAANISLGLMLGVVPAFASFFGLGLEVRHITLSAGQLAAAIASLGPQAMATPQFASAVAGVLVIGMLNLAVSFHLAFRLALRAQGISNVNRRRIQAAIRSRLRRAWWTFLLPPSERAAASHAG